MKAKSVTKELSLEAYLDYLHSNHQSDLTVNFLNQIIYLHGFKKIYRQPKKTLEDAVKTIDLIDPSRFTLKHDISPDAAFLELEDVIADLNELNWQECSVTSLQSFGNVNCGSKDVSRSESKRKWIELKGSACNAILASEGASSCGSANSAVKAKRSNMKRKLHGDTNCSGSSVLSIEWH